VKPTRLTPMKDSTGYLTWLGAWLVQRRHVHKCRRLKAARPAPAPVIGYTCDASIPSVPRGALGPCVLRYDHDGPVHQAADGARWWATL
jgi:hypothetical protein